MCSKHDYTKLDMTVVVIRDGQIIKSYFMKYRFDTLILKVKYLYLICMCTVIKEQYNNIENPNTTLMY